MKEMKEDSEDRYDEQNGHAKHGPFYDGLGNRLAFLNRTGCKGIGSFHASSKTSFCRCGDL